MCSRFLVKSQRVLGSQIKWFNIINGITENGTKYNDWLQSELRRCGLYWLFLSRYLIRTWECKHVSVLCIHATGEWHIYDHWCQGAKVCSTTFKFDRNHQNVSEFNSLGTKNTCIWMISKLKRGPHHDCAQKYKLSITLFKAIFDILISI